MLTVTKRDGKRQAVHFDKITARLSRLAYGLDSEVNIGLISQKVVAGIYDGVPTTELDVLAAETAAAMATQHADYAVLASRIAVNNLHKETQKEFSKVMETLYNIQINGRPSPMISKEVIQIVRDNADFLDSHVIHSRDDDFHYFGFKTLLQSYLLKDGQGRVLERPQHMYMRVALGIHGADLDRVIETYDLMSQRFFTHATPTLFNSGTPNNQMSSCFLTGICDDIGHIYDKLRDCAIISKYAGGIGMSVHDIRAKGSYISGTNGTSNGLVPMLRVFNATARYVDQGGNKRPGSIAVYIEPWHADIFDILELRKNTGAEELRARDLFYALWIPDLFMQRVQEDGHWTLMSPSESPGLADVWGDAFVQLYTKYEREQRSQRVIRARELWSKILEVQIESGLPYMLFKDSVNRKSNQQHYGTIKCSNLCTEICEFSGINKQGEEELAVCNLGSISLPAFVSAGKFDFAKLHAIARTITRNLNRIIDINFYPLEATRRSNLNHRPLGMGVQGLADVFCMLRLPFTGPEARKLNVQIFETIYHAGLTESCALAAKHGVYPCYEGSPASKGLLQYDLWSTSAASAASAASASPNGQQQQQQQPTDLWDWIALKADIAKHGLRNSLFVAPMPTASTSQILGNNEAFEPFTSNIYTRRTKAGEFMVVNKHLMRDLRQLGLWTPDMVKRLIASRGSVQDMTDLPQWVRDVYKTVWEIPQRLLVDMAAERGPFIDQSQSFNVFIAEPTEEKLTSLHFYTWARGLKTGMYYLRARPAADPIQFTVDNESKKKPTPEEVAACSRLNREACTACSS
jgi:ribonucleoside-diphosphate reductase subunit M1